MFVDQSLFGGALKLKIPENFKDISEVRQVPDNQEVFCDKQGYSSILIDLLEIHQEAVQDSMAKFHFEQLADDNNAFETQILNVTNMDYEQNLTKQNLFGIQLVKNEQNNQKLEIFLVVYRIKEINVDIIVSLNTTDQQFIQNNPQVIENLKQLQIIDYSLFC